MIESQEQKLLQEIPHKKWNQNWTFEIKMQHLRVAARLSSSVLQSSTFNQTTCIAAVNNCTKKG